MRLLTVLGAVLALLAAGCTAHDPAPDPAPDTEATRPGAGTLLTARPLTGAAALPGAASTRAISYVSEAPDGSSSVVTGTVSVPRGEPPAQGWPVVSWAHGTTGYATVCAPSLDFDGGPAHGYLEVVQPSLDHWVTAGYAVVQTDYQGLGGPGPAPYINGASEAANVVDIVRAARHLDESLGTTWAAIGHSQGGQAALFTAARAAERAPELDLKAAVAIAPGSGFAGFAEAADSADPAMAELQPFLPLVVLGAAAADPGIVPEDLFGEQFRPFLDAARTRCLDQLRELDPIPAGQVLAPDAQTDRLSDYLSRQEPATVRPRVPVLVVQGLADTTVPPALTDALVDSYCSDGITVDYRSYSGADHRRSIAASLPDTESFVAAMMHDETPPDSCDEGPR
ncbi:lipase family protein [Mycolicibacillus trivialis]